MRRKEESSQQAFPRASELSTLRFFFLGEIPIWWIADQPEFGVFSRIHNQKCKKIDEI